MLKSTYRPAVSNTDLTETPLPSGWTEHKAPTGHSYYYNASTQQSTYTRPAPPSDEPLQIDYGATEPDQVIHASFQAMDQFQRNNAPQPQLGTGHFTGGRSYQEHSRKRGNQGDRPKTKAPIPDCAPWILVKTKMGRRFVHNTETKQSLWKFPQDVMMAVIEMDRLEWEAKKKAEEQKQEGADTKSEDGRQADENVERPAAAVAETTKTPRQPADYDSDSYEEVEVTDDEGEEGGDPTAKRPRLAQGEAEPAPAGPVEFDEDDIAWQLAELEGEDGPDQYDNLEPQLDGGNQDDDEEEDGLPMTDEDNIALFRSLLDSSGISSYSTFEKLIEDERIVEDPRYVSLRTVSARKEAFSQWAKDRSSELQALRQQQSEQIKRAKDPKVDYLQFLQRNATPKLYWPEFKRKFKRAPEMVDRGLQDKEREKLYRDLVSKLKLPEADRRKELVGLLKETAKKEKNAFQRGMQLQDLPDGIVRDVKFYALDNMRSEELVSTFLDTL